MLTVDELKTLNEAFCFSPYGIDKENRYLQNMKLFFEENSNCCVSANGTEEFNKILENSRDLLRNDCALGLTKLCTYLKQQKDILELSRSKFSNDRYTYERLFTFVAKVALFDIEQAFLLRKPLSRFHPDMNQYATDLEINSLNAIKIIDTFKLPIDFKNEIFIPQRELIKNACSIKHIHVNEQMPHENNSTSGCLSIIIGFMVITLLSAL